MNWPSAGEKARSRLDREIIRLKVEREALKKESDRGSKSRLQNLEKVLDLEKKSADLRSKRQAEESKLSGAQKMKSEVEQLRTERAKARQRGENQKSGELAYGRIPELGKRRAAVEANENSSISETAGRMIVIETFERGPIGRLPPSSRASAVRGRHPITLNIPGKA
jgi:ATP-dependent Clp protease ATP-binding subunit ClpB